MNKSPGFDFLSNEFFKLGNSEFLLGTLRTLLNLMSMTGHVHKNFIIFIIKPIPMAAVIYTIRYNGVKICKKTFFLKHGVQNSHRFT